VADTTDRDTPASAITKALRLLSSFSYAEPILGVSELARRLDLPKSSVHRMLVTLVAEGFVEPVPVGRYRLSLKVYELGQQVAFSHRVRQVAHPLLERLRADTGEASHLAVLADADVVFLDRLESPELMRVFVRTGRRTPAHATSSGKCLLAFGTAADVETVVSAGLPRVGPRTLTSRAALERALAAVRNDGYAVSVDESANGVVSVGAPIFDELGACIAAISLAGPPGRMGDQQLTRYIPMLVRTAAAISKGLAAT
jgi:IclR family transcriptional regulator, KDG regulon repressor